MMKLKNKTVNRKIKLQNLLAAGLLALLLGGCTGYSNKSADAPLSSDQDWLCIPCNPARDSSGNRPVIPRDSGQAVGAERRS